MLHIWRRPRPATRREEQPRPGCSKVKGGPEGRRVSDAKRPWGRRSGSEALRRKGNLATSGQDRTNPTATQPRDHVIMDPWKQQGSLIW